MENFPYGLGAFVVGGALGLAFVLLFVWIQRRIGAFFGRKPSPTGPDGKPAAAAPAAPAPVANPPMDSARLAQLIEAALDVQRKDRDMRNADAAYWGDTGYWVGRAVGEAAEVLREVPAGGDLRTWLQSRREMLAEVHEQFRREADDPDGYGSGTFHELRRALDEIDACFD